MSKKNTAELEPTTVSAGCFDITNVQVYPLKEMVGKTRAMVRVVLSDQLQLTGMRVVDGSNGLFVSYPNDPSHKGDDFKSLFYPVTKELRDHIETAVLARYQDTVQEAGAAR